MLVEVAVLMRVTLENLVGIWLRFGRRRHETPHRVHRVTKYRTARTRQNMVIISLLTRGNKAGVRACSRQHLTQNPMLKLLSSVVGDSPSRPRATYSRAVWRRIQSSNFHLLSVIHIHILELSMSHLTKQHLPLYSPEIELSTIHAKSAFFSYKRRRVGSDRSQHSQIDSVGLR